MDPRAPAQHTQSRPSGEEFRHVIGHFATGVTVITTRLAGRAFGTTANAISSVSLEPPMMLVCMNRTSTTGAALAEAGRFAINILGRHQAELAHRYATKDPDKFDAEHTIPGPYGQPLIPGAIATLECIVADEMVGGTHTVYLAEAASAVAAGGEPLAYFRGRFGHLRLS